MIYPGITQSSLVCLRFDDYHQDVNNNRWEDVLTRYNDRGLRGVVAICPKYQDERLSGDVIEFLHDLKDDGWELAQHGYEHVNVGDGRGGLLYDERSEFAGLDYEEQAHRVGAGRDILESHGINPTTFIPPWHEYDRTTARVLAANGFDCINEGRWPVPRTIEEITLVPTHVPALTPYMIGAGVVTAVSHPHLDDDPMSSAEAIAGYETRIRTPSEIVRWWRNQSKIGKIIDSAEPVYSRYSY